MRERLAAPVERILILIEQAARTDAVAAPPWSGRYRAVIARRGHLWALAALPVVFAVEILAPHVPRLRWAFYAYYPLHLTALALLL